MPNRIIREGINESHSVNRLSCKAEIFYRRLLLLVDDWGRTEADIARLRVRLFGMQLDRWDEQDVAKALAECIDALHYDQETPLVGRYFSDGKFYLEITKFKQRRRHASKYPGPEIIDGKEQYLRLTNVSSLMLVSKRCPVSERRRRRRRLERVEEFMKRIDC